MLQAYHERRAARTENKRWSRIRRIANRQRARLDLGLVAERSQFQLNLVSILDSRVFQQTEAIKEENMSVASVIAETESGIPEITRQKQEAEDLERARIALEQQKLGSLDRIMRRHIRESRRRKGEVRTSSRVPYYEMSDGSILEALNGLVQEGKAGFLVVDKQPAQGNALVSNFTQKYASFFETLSEKDRSVVEARLAGLLVKRERSKAQAPKRILARKVNKLIRSGVIDSRHIENGKVSISGLAENYQLNGRHLQSLRIVEQDRQERQQRAKEYAAVVAKVLVDAQFVRSQLPMYVRVLETNIPLSTLIGQAELSQAVEKWKQQIENNMSIPLLPNPAGVPLEELKPTYMPGYASGMVVDVDFKFTTFEQERIAKLSLIKVLEERAEVLRLEEERRLVELEKAEMVAMNILLSVRGLPYLLEQERGLLEAGWSRKQIAHARIEEAQIISNAGFSVALETASVAADIFRPRLPVAPVDEYTFMETYRTMAETAETVTFRIPSKDEKVLDKVAKVLDVGLPTVDWQEEGDYLVIKVPKERLTAWHSYHLEPFIVSS